MYQMGRQEIRHKREVSSGSQVHAASVFQDFLSIPASLVWNFQALSVA